MGTGHLVHDTADRATQETEPVRERERATGTGVRRSAVGAALVAMVLVGTAAGWGEQRGGGRRIEVDLVSDRPAQASVCAGDVCSSATAGATTRYTGDWQGTSLGGGSSVRGPVHITSMGMGMFTGSVTGCGEGTFTWASEVRIPVANPGAAEADWHIVPGSGTGGLSGIRGGGVVIAGVNSPTELRAHLTGKVHCG